MQVCGSVGGYVGACSAADGGAASPGPGRAGFPKISQIRFFDPIFDPVFDPVPDPGQRPFPLLKSIISRFSNRA